MTCSSPCAQLSRNVNIDQDSQPRGQEAGELPVHCPDSPGWCKWSHLHHSTLPPWLTATTGWRDTPANHSRPATWAANHSPALVYRQRDKRIRSVPNCFVLSVLAGYKGRHRDHFALQKRYWSRLTIMLTDSAKHLQAGVNTTTFCCSNIEFSVRNSAMD